MPYEIMPGHDECEGDMPVAVVKVGDGEVMGCHANEDDAAEQIAALEAAEAEASLVAAAVLPEGELAWSGALAVEGAWTGDGRFIEEGALTWADLPLPLMGDRALLDGGGDGHFGSFVVGRIETIERDGTTIRAAGVIADTAEGRRVAQHVADGNAVGVSIDPDQVEVGEFDEEEEGLRFTALRIRGATVTPFPAFVEAQITIDGQAVDAEAVAAAVAPVAPPADWFDDPGFDALQQHITISDDGRIAGHLCALNECHIGYTQTCLTAASLVSDWRYFTTGYVPCETGCRIPTGPITLAGGHADLELDARTAKQHYDDTDSAVADVALGVDEHGIWFAGALRPDVTPEQVRRLAASGVSGDWRPIGGRLELVAICAVNVPGFPKALGARVAAGEVVALVASAARPERETFDEWQSREQWNTIVDLGARLARVEALVARLEPQVREQALAALRPLSPVARPVPSAFRHRR